ncbi:OLC1v1023455C1 [Oldenlandia corymbosa var. corymbosa]|uniref:OLC1v1023455C1 n=1 Tax=Oldenlandia corymbosa var. corymbosa TaxID=529605 RepID=A0AAV1C2D3_OLDCO|nr:OLC1v1023455C1 [Oldenlandia corymbosa var. corymbosa]
MQMDIVHHLHSHNPKLPSYKFHSHFHFPQQTCQSRLGLQPNEFPELALKFSRNRIRRPSSARKWRKFSVSASNSPLDLTEDNIEQVLADARVELAQLFDVSVGITGKAELADLDGPYVKLRLSGKFWHKRSTVVARLGNYLKQRIPEILEVDIEDEKQLDDSPASF